MGHCGGLKKGSRQAKSDHPTATEASIGHCGGRERKAPYPRCLAAFPRAEQGQAYVPFVRLGAVVAKNLISWIFSYRERLRRFLLRAAARSRLAKFYAQFIEHGLETVGQQVVREPRPHESALAIVVFDPREFSPRGEIA